MQIGKLSGLSGVSPAALRLYEKRGLIASRRRNNGYRDYAEETVARVGYIRTAQSLGFSLTEIREQLGPLALDPEPDAELAALLAAKAADIQKRIDGLTKIRDELIQRSLASCPLRNGHKSG